MSTALMDQLEQHSLMFSLFFHQLRQTVQRFFQEKLTPYADEIDKANEFLRLRVSPDTSAFNKDQDTGILDKS